MILSWPAVLILFGLACFVCYLRNGRRWVWGIAVLALSVGITWLWMVLE